MTLENSPQSLSPRWSRVGIIFAGAFAAAGLPTAGALALGLQVPNDLVWLLLTVVLIYSAGFMVGLAYAGQWAARIEPDTEQSPASFEVLRQRLLALAAQHQEFSVTEGAPGELTISRVPHVSISDTGGRRSSSILVLRLHASRRQARVVETAATLVWSHDRAHARWSASWFGFRGIRMESYQRGATDLMSRLVHAVVESGWVWQPVIFR